MNDRAGLPGWTRVRPRARYPSAQSATVPGAEASRAGVLVLQLGDNPTTDYYLRPRLDASGRAWSIADLRDDPAACAALAGDGPLSVVLCRYASGPWLDALERARPRLAGVALMVDDDLAGMVLDPALPAAYRLHVFGWHGRWTGRLSRLTSAVWASTPALAERYATPVVLPPLPEADPPPPDPGAPPRVVYPGQALHRRERAFVLEVARRVAERRPEARFEVVRAAGDPDAPNVETVPERSWPDYRREAAARPAAISLAPLFPSPVNAVRAPVKAFDAARLGAAGLFADAPPYRGFVADGIDGRLLPMRPQAWADAVAELLERPERRLALVEAARTRLVALRRSPSALPL